MDAIPAGSPEAPQPSRQSRIELIELDLIALARMTATVSANLKIRGNVADEDHVYILLALDNLFYLSRGILPPETVRKIEAFQKTVSQAGDKTKTIEAAETLIAALDDLGISKFFEETIEPPFMMEESPKEPEAAKAG